MEAALIPGGLVQFVYVLCLLPHPTLCLLVLQRSSLSLLQGRLTWSCSCQGLWQLLCLTWPPQGHLFAHESSLYVTQHCKAAVGAAHYRALGRES